MSNRRIVAAVATPEPDDELARLRAENERLRAVTAPKPLTFKVSPKGAVSVYGLQRFPVTLYVDQWERLIGHVDLLQTFMVDNEGRLTRKSDG
jgi:hypothetical protein